MATRQEWSPAINTENYLFQWTRTVLSHKFNHRYFSPFLPVCRRQFFHQHTCAKNPSVIYVTRIFFPICISTKINRDATETIRLRFPLLTEMRKVNVLYVHFLFLEFLAIIRDTAQMRSSNLLFLSKVLWNTGVTFSQKLFSLISAEWKLHRTGTNLIIRSRDTQKNRGLENFVWRNQILIAKICSETRQK